MRNRIDTCSRHIRILDQVPRTIEEAAPTDDTALARQAHAVILVHNHPSGSTSPSEADVAVTRRMKEAGELLQIEMLDHVILGAPGAGDEKRF